MPPLWSRAAMPREGAGGMAARMRGSGSMAAALHHGLEFMLPSPVSLRR